MKRWVGQQLATALVHHSNSVVVVIDPDSIVDATTDPDSTPSIEIVDHWWALRAAYERSGRRRPMEAEPLVLVLRPPMTAAEIPWDIQQACTVVSHIRLPGESEIQAALRELDEDEFDAAMAVIRSGREDPALGILRSVTGVSLRGDPLGASDQLRLAARLALRKTPSSALASLGRRWVTDATLVGLLESPPDPGPLQNRWQDFLGGVQDEWQGVFGQTKPEMTALFATRLLEPALAPDGSDPWTRVGVRLLTDEEKAEDLLAAPPDVSGQTVQEWIEAALWWGDVRRMTVHASRELRTAAWAVWEQLDAAFVPWLQQRYGTLLTSASPWPSSVHRIGQFLARRIREGKAERVMLIVLDGLGHAQWSHLQETVELEILEAGSTFALVPTYTTVSRQAIFAGDLPHSSPTTLWTTQPEPARWRELWAGEGIPVTRVAYHRVRGRLPHDHLGLGDAQVIGLVVNAVDDLMHTSELFGDAQLLANLDVWTDNGFLTDLVARSTAAGFETWITSDHGNLECVGTRGVSEGVAIEAAGKRLLRYPNRTLRDASAASGIVWDDIPGMPSSAEPLLFAAGRAAFTKNLVSVSHGGLSLDEVIVPLARVSA